jgi:hypothetical protein
MKRLGLLVVVTTAAACGPAPNLLPVDDLNRPTDVAFMCFGALEPGAATDGGAPDASAPDGGSLQVSGRPIRACHPQGQYDPGPTSQTRTFAFMPNSAAGTLTVVDADHWKLVDLNLDTAGYGTAPLGQLPEQISASDDGCRLLSANRGSCDLTLVDPSVLVAPVFASQNGVDVPLASPRTGSVTFRPLKKDGTQLLAAPYEAVFLPQDTTSLVQSLPAGSPLPLLPAPGPLCGDNAMVDPPNWQPQGAPKSSAPKSWYALVTYPSCDLITLIELPSGNIIDSAKVVAVRSSDGKSDSVVLQDTGPSPVCPISIGDCAGQAIPPQTAAGASDAATGDGAPHLAPSDAGGGASASDAAVDTGVPGTGASPPGTGGAMGTGGAATGTGGSAGSADAGATGGAPGGALLGNQFPDIPYVGTGPLAPSGIAIVPDGSRAYVSLGNASYVLSVGITSAGLSQAGNTIYLHEGARGSTRVRLNVDPTLLSPQTGVMGAFVGDAQGQVTGEATSPSANFAGLFQGRQYLYVIARDGTVRVIDVFDPKNQTECETNVDPLQLPATPYNALSSCIPVTPAYRRPFSVGPGIHFPTLPIDVAALDVQRPTDYGEQSVNGAHAFVITDSGIVYLVNINPILRDFTAWTLDTSQNPPIYVQNNAVPESAPFVNTLRDRNEITYSLTLDPTSGPPRVDAPPPVPATGPYVEPFWTEGSAVNPTALSGSYIQTFVFFPQMPTPATPTLPQAPNPNDPIDRRAVTAQTWSVAWEGAITGNRNSGKALPLEQGLSDFPGGAPAGALPIDSMFEDGGANYCAFGVVPGDMVTLTGCTDNSQCGLGEQCAIGDNGSSASAGLAVTGICIDPNQEGKQLPLCAEFLNSLRRYDIVAASPQDLVVRPHLDEIVISSLINPPCTPAGGAGVDGGAAADAGADGGPPPGDSCPDTNDDPTTGRFTCESAYPGGGGQRRCLMLCSSDSQCRPGRVCVDFGAKKSGGQICDEATGVCRPTPAGGADLGTDDAGTAAGTCADPNHRCFCADAPIFDEAGKQCFDQLVNYQVVAGKSFVVGGSQAGIVTTATLPSNGMCAPNPTPDARFSFRIPMNAPACTGLPDVSTIDSRVDPDFVDPSVATAAQMNARALLTLVTSTPAPQDPCFYIGGPVSSDLATDTTAAANPDAAVTPLPTHVRALFKNSQIAFVLANVDRGPTFQFATTFDVHGGFAPQLVQEPATVEVSMPARIIVGPVDSLAQITTGTPVAPTYAAPYLFVVDQRRLGREQGGGPTRGQLLRINPFGYTVTVGSAPTGYQPLFEDYNTSGGLFPIQ